MWARFAIIAAMTVSLAYGHVTVQPKQSVAGKTETYIVRVPTEKSVPTVGIEVEFPDALEVSSFEAKPGWKLVERKNTAGKLIGVILSGGSIPPGEAAQFTFTARNPKAEGKLSFKAVQIYQDGSRVEWSGPEGSRTPAPLVEVK